jgi:hypothetical protein
LGSLPWRWLFGTSAVGPGIGTWHFDGRTWKPVPIAAATVFAASATSASNIRQGRVPVQRRMGAVIDQHMGDGHDPQGRRCAPVPRGQRVVSGKWTAQHLPWTADDLGEPLRDGKGGFWLAATASGKEWIWHRTVTGKWSRIAFISGTSINVFSYAPVPATSSFWAAGSRTTGISSAVIWAYGPLR